MSGNAGVSALARLRGAFGAAGASATARMADRLLRTAAECPPTPLPDLSEAPEPVLRYLRQALPVSQSVRVVRLRQTGELRTDPRSDRWMRFEAEHIAVPAAEGFVWDARVRMVPLLHVRVRDALAAGEGSGRVSLLSLFPLAAAGGTPEMNSGSLHRYLAEAVWYPSALAPSGSLRWSGIDDRRALATLTSHGVTVSLEFRFDETGQVAAIYTPARWGRFGRTYLQRPWEGHFREFREWSGLFVPAEGEVGWHVDGVWRCVWRARIVEFEAETGL